MPLLSPMLLSNSVKKEKNGEKKGEKPYIYILYTQSKASKIRKTESTLHLKTGTGGMLP